MCGILPSGPSQCVCEYASAGQAAGCEQFNGKGHREVLRVTTVVKAMATGQEVLRVYGESKERAMWQVRVSNMSRSIAYARS